MLRRLFGSDEPIARRRSDLPDPPPHPLSRLWWPGVALGLVALVALVLLPQGETAWDFVYLCASLLSLVVLLGAALAMPPRARPIWWLLFAFQAVTLAAQAVFEWQVQALPEVSFPSVADAVYLAAYLPAFGALALLIHRRAPGRDREAWIDASILTVTVICVFGLFVLGPLLTSGSLDGLAAYVAVAYPLLDLALLSALIWLLVGDGRPSVALLLLTSSFGLTLVADIARDLVLATDQAGPTAQTLGTIRLAALIVMAAASTTPTAESLTTPRHQAYVRHTTPRLAILAIGVLTVPAIVAFRLWGDADTTTLLLALAAIIVIILAMWRLQILVSTVDRQQRVTELVLDSTGDGIVGLDGDGLVLFANLSARRMLRCRESDLIGRRFHDIAHHETPDGRPFAWQDCPVTALVMSGGEGLVSDQSYLRRDGTLFPVEVVVTPLVIDGVVAGAVQSFRDVSEREAVDELKRQFVSVVSHELRTPLTSIKGSLQMLDSGLMGPLTDDQQELLRMAVSNSERLGQLVNDILDIERLDAGRMPLSPERVSARTLADDVVHAMTGAADAAGITLSAESEDDTVDLDIDVDPHRMLQVLTNLVGNAVKFSERGSQVTVSTSRRDDIVRISVIDQGRGIPADRLDSIFDRFGQVDAGDARREGGTGLGLAISREIVLRSGGQIEVESELGVGTTFTVTVPAADRVADTEGIEETAP